jgi:hypothetical protein|tara:strand:- start:49 stop:378 length:330 start_codon:yes stop_codon:yes gene_type:complete
MEKFLSVPIWAAGVIVNYQLVPCTDIKVIEVGDQAGPGANAATTTTLWYGDSSEVQITHATVGAPSATNSGTQFRQELQIAVVEALQSSWTNPTLVFSPTFQVSAIVKL